MMPAALVVDGLLIVRGVRRAPAAEERLRDTQLVDALDGELRRAVDQAVREYFAAYDAGSDPGTSGTCPEPAFEMLGVMDVAERLKLSDSYVRRNALRWGATKSRSGEWVS
jgi:hypothetical protein